MQHLVAIAGNVRCDHPEVEERCKACGPDHALMAVLTHCDCSPLQVATVRHEVRDQDRHELWHDDPSMWGFYLVHQQEFVRAHQGGPQARLTPKAVCSGSRPGPCMR
jgi:hypothetical protein